VEAKVKILKRFSVEDVNVKHGEKYEINFER